MTTEDMWVLHSPYPDKTWRGTKKCMGSDDVPSAFLFFSTKEEAAEYARKKEMEEYFIPVQVQVQVPEIRTLSANQRREALDELTRLSQEMGGYDELDGG